MISSMGARMPRTRNKSSNTSSQTPGLQNPHELCGRWSSKRLESARSGTGRDTQLKAANDST